MDTRCGELVAANEPTVIAKPLPDAIMVEDGQCDGCLANSADTNEDDGCEVFGQTDDLLDQLITSETGPRGRRRQFATCAGSKYKTVNPPVIQVADLV